MIDQLRNKKREKSKNSNANEESEKTPRVKKRRNKSSTYLGSRRIRHETRCEALCDHTIIYLGLGSILLLSSEDSVPVAAEIEKKSSMMGSEMGLGETHGMEYCVSGGRERIFCRPSLDCEPETWTELRC